MTTLATDRRTGAETDRDMRTVKAAVGVMVPGDTRGTTQDVSETAIMGTITDTHRGVARGHMCRSVGHL